MSHKLSYSVETAHSATTYSHVHTASLMDSRSISFVCLQLAVKQCVSFVLLRGWGWAASRKGLVCLVPASAARVTQGEQGCCSSWGTEDSGIGGEGWLIYLYIQTYSWEHSQAHFHSSLSRSRPCSCYSLSQLKSLFLGNELSLGALPLTQQPAGPGWWNGMQHHSLLLNIN